MGKAALALFCILSLGAGLEASARSRYADSEIRSVENSTDSKIRDLRDQEIRQLRIALGLRMPTHRRADIYYRLAEIYLEAYHSEFLLEGRVHDKRLQAGRRDPYIDRAHSQPYLQLGIKACQEVLRFRIPYSKMDAIYYFLGFNYGELGKKKESLKYFDLLTRKFPGSAFASEGYRELGDAAFSGLKFRKAQAYYEAALRRSSPELRPRLLHKLAWSYYRTKQFERAEATMKQAIASAGAAGDRGLMLKEEALKDLAVFMTETGRVKEAIAYFQKNAPDAYYPEALEKLGRQYERNVQPEKATQVYEALLRTRPESQEAFRVRVKLIDLDLRRGRFREALSRFLAGTVPKGGDTDTKIAAQNLRAMVRRTATEHHEAYRKKKNRADLQVAEAYYSAYLEKFLGEDDPRNEKPEIQMYLAEVKRDLGKSKEASELYRKVVDSRDKRYAKEAGALWMASLAEAIRKSNQKGTEPSDLEKQFIEAADQFREALSDTTEGKEAGLRAAQVLAGYRSTQKDAIKRIKKMIADWPKAPQARVGAKLWIQILLDRANAPGASASDKEDAASDLADAISDIRKNKDLMSGDQVSGGGKLRALLADQSTRLKVSAIAKDEHEKDYSAAGKGYEAFAADQSQRDLAEKAYADSVGAYVKGDDFSSADRIFTTWLKRYPRSAKARDSLRFVATALLIKGKLDDSAAVFKRAGLEAGDSESLQTAARIYEGNNDPNRSQVMWASFLRFFPNAPDRWAVALSLARSQDRANLVSEAAKAYRYCMAGPAEFEAECGARLGDLYAKSKDLKGAKDLFRKVSLISGKGRKRGAVSPFVGYARYRLAEMTEEEASLPPLRLPEAVLKKGINQRMDFLEPLSRAYLSAVDAGGPWAVGALERLASFAIRFADDVDAIHPPSAFAGNPKAQAQFRRSLAGISEPLRRKAIGTWSDAYVKAVDAELLSPALPHIADRLADARASAPFRSQGPRGGFRLAGMPADGGKEGRSGAFESTRRRLEKNPQDGAAWVDYGNLLWGDGKPLVAKIAYDRALALNPKNPTALSDRGVVLLSSEGEEDWFSAIRGAALFRQALKQDGFFIAAKMNLASLMNYYRVFAVARPLWEQVIARADSADAEDGLGVALQGAGRGAEAAAAFKKAAKLGAKSSRFAAAFNEAARDSVDGANGAQKCLDRLGDLDESKLYGFEKSSFESLKRTCLSWKRQK